MSEKKQWTPIGERPLVFLDVETTGLDPEENEIIEIALIAELPGDFKDLPKEVVPTGDKSLKYVAAWRTIHWSSKVKPQRLETAHPKALEVNGYADHPEEWDDAPTFEELIPLLVYFLHDCLVIGHNVGFDIRFLEEAFKRAGMPMTEDRKAESPKLNLGHRVCTMQLAFEHLVPVGLKSVSMDNVRRFMGWSSEGAHTAMKDVYDAQKLYYTLMRASGLKRWWWGFRGRRLMQIAP